MATKKKATKKTAKKKIIKEEEVAQIPCRLIQDDEMLYSRNEQYPLYIHRSKFRIPETLVNGNCDYILSDGTKVVGEPDENSIYLISPSGIVYNCFDYFWEMKTAKDILSMIYDDVLCVAVAAIQGKFFIVNGDIDEEDGGNLVSFLEKYQNEISKNFKYVTTSFDTLGNIFGITKEFNSQSDFSVAVATHISSGNIQLIDSSPDDSIKLTPEQKEAKKKLNTHKRKIGLADMPKNVANEIAEAEKLLIAPSGYTLIEGSFHRPATTLFFNKETKETALLGMDDDSFFGVILPKKETTVIGAYKSLMPKEAIGKSFIRQGEWFFVLTSTKEHAALNRKAKNIIESWCPLPYVVVLPMEHAESNPHVLNFIVNSEVLEDMENNNGFESTAEESRKAFSSVNFIFEDSLDKLMYARNFTCVHAEHPPVSDTTGMWFKIVPNLAVRSVSATRLVD